MGSRRGSSPSPGSAHANILIRLLSQNLWGPSRLPSSLAPSVQSAPNAQTRAPLNAHCHCSVASLRCAPGPCHSLGTALRASAPHAVFLAEHVGFPADQESTLSPRCRTLRGVLPHLPQQKPQSPVGARARLVPDPASSPCARRVWCPLGRPAECAHRGGAGPCGGAPAADGHLRGWSGRCFKNERRYKAVKLMVSVLLRFSHHGTERTGDAHSLESKRHPEHS